MADAAYIVNDGLGLITGLIKVASGAEPHHVGWGVGTTGAAVTDTGLETASAEARTEATTSLQQTTTANDTYRAIAAIECTSAAKAITEVAMYDAATGGTCFMHGTFSAINVSVGDTITFTIDTVFDQA